MRVVMLGNVTCNSCMVATREVIEQDIKWFLEGYVLTVSSDHEPLLAPNKTYKPICVVHPSAGFSDRLPILDEEMFVKYDDWFSESPTEDEKSNFAMNFGFVPHLREIEPPHEA